MKNSTLRAEKARRQPTRRGWLPPKAERTLTTLYITKELRDELDREKVNPPYKAWDLQIHEAFLRNQYGDAEEKLIADYRSKFSCSRREAIQHLIKEVAEARASSNTTGSEIAGKVEDRIQAELRKRSPGSPLPPSRK